MLIFRSGGPYGVQIQKHIKHMKMAILISLLLSTTLLFSQESTYYKTLSNDTIIIDSVFIVNKDLEKKISKFILKNVSCDTQFIFVSYSGYENIKTDTVDFELWLSHDYSRVFNIWWVLKISFFRRFIEDRRTH